MKRYWLYDVSGSAKQALGMKLAIIQYSLH